MYCLVQQAAMGVGFWKVAHHPPQLLRHGSYTHVQIDLLPIEFMWNLQFLVGPMIRSHSFCGPWRESLSTFFVFRMV